MQAAFEGSNEDHEIETLDEFLERVADMDPNTLSLDGWTFQAVDFSPMTPERFNMFNWKGANLWGCTFPEGISSQDVRRKDAVVLDNMGDVPFKSFRGFMYTQSELKEHDADIYQWYLTNQNKLQSLFAMTTHDYCIKDALYDYLEGKTVVSIMGGHGMSRKSNAYANVVLLGWMLANAGFLVVTGGGPGAMEAGNLGAYLYRKSREEVDEALKIIASGSYEGLVHEYLNPAPALQVLERFGPSINKPSVGVPTWRYGHEPSNKFATYQAKLFSNALREDGIIAISNGGIIFTPGSAGTRQEIFQDACGNHYTDEQGATPMVFFDCNFWKESGVWDLINTTSQGRPYHDLLLCSDNTDTIVEHLIKHRAKKGLPIVTLEILQSKFWMLTSRNGGAVSKDRALLLEKSLDTKTT
jgi:predicted Rossmann-fold nucleotide-binding protein